MDPSGDFGNGQQAPKIYLEWRPQIPQGRIYSELDRNGSGSPGSVIY